MPEPMSKLRVVANLPSSQYRQSYLPTRSSIPSCGERLACRGPNPSAQLYCSECGTNQCEACELLIHAEARFKEHPPREPVASPDPRSLCEGPCPEQNLADIRCHTCKKNLCYTCDRNAHLLRRRFAHIKVRFQHYLDHLKPEAEEEDEEGDQYFSVEPEQSVYVSGDDMMEPISIPPDVVSSTRSGDSLDAKKEVSGSFLLVDDKEALQVSSVEDFLTKLGCESTIPVKVVSIFGNTGEGKSHTLNHTFFGGREVFKTSSRQSSCTVGVWAAYCSELRIIVVDTEGLLGLADNQNQRARLLLKVLAVSDIVIYRTRAERLHNDLFSFLGDASRAYILHFSKELKALKERCNFAGPISTLGPAVIIFHETIHTQPLVDEKDHSRLDQLKLRFQKLNQDIDAFSALVYVGIRTVSLPTRFTDLLDAVTQNLENSTVRSVRPVEVIYQALKLLSEKFSGDLDRTVPNTFPDQYFTCRATCLSCGAGCTKSMNHSDSHQCSTRCQYNHEFENKVFQCKACYEKMGKEVELEPQIAAKGDSPWMGAAYYAWSGYVLECPGCGVIYRSRQYWYGNKDPTETVARKEIVHVWPEQQPPLAEVTNTARKVIDNFHIITDTVTSYSALPAKTISSWMADQIAPPYWVPNYKVLRCHKCEKEFHQQDTKHHCRACGEGFCDDCSSRKRPVPERGWGNEDVRVCDDCFSKEDGTTTVEEAGSAEERDLTARKVGEVLRSTLGVVASAIEYPIGFIKDSARPAYWVPDIEIKECAVCTTPFGPRLSLHHCRGCGMGVCDDCSKSKRPVPSRGWEGEVRVCDKCNKRADL
ncbi:zinc finger FYVE domain-containing protein 1-like isoform X2 [Ornithodoros turicata]|uniref:zinc finger FYVE domain-containing protein 1-like isoform X2 n=1 Tax=Ornithodoros turicata TaxID=34597 RepID=UPI003138C754